MIIIMQYYKKNDVMYNYFLNYIILSNAYILNLFISECMQSRRKGLGTIALC